MPAGVVRCKVRVARWRKRAPTAVCSLAPLGRASRVKLTPGSAAGERADFREVERALGTAAGRAARYGGAERLVERERPLGERVRSERGGEGFHRVARGVERVAELA